MEKRLNKKMESYISEFKKNIKDRATQIGISQHNSEMNKLLQYIYDYERLEFEKDDFQKRKRVKNVVPFFDRCCAKRASGEQCTRRKKIEIEYCGTHMKGTPHGIIVGNEDSKPTTQKVEVWAQDIKGIIYYLDKTNNVYQPEDIITNKQNPRIIAKYTQQGDTYSIPELYI